MDPREAGAVEIFTGAFPAEFGGQRMGAVVSVRSLTFSDPPPPGVIALGAGELGTQEAQLQKQFSIGKAQASIAVENLTSDRGLDTPAENAINDASSTANQFLRIGLPLDARDSLALDVANQYASYQIPINTDPNDLNAGEVSLPNQYDVQREYDRFLALSFTRNDADGNGYFRNRSVDALQSRRLRRRPSGGRPGLLPRNGGDAANVPGPDHQRLRLSRERFVPRPRRSLRRSARLQRPHDR
jgi:hypothetical protein